MDVTPLHTNGAAMDRRIERPHARRRKLAVRISLGLAVLAAAAALWWFLPSSGSLAVDAATIRIAPVTRAAFADYVPLRAQVAPLQTVYVTAISGGQVEALIASDGQSVAAGAPLARLANPTLALDVASRSANIAGQLSSISGQRLSIQQSREQTERDITSARNELAKAEALLRQKQILFDKQIVTAAAVTPLRDEVAYQRSRLTALTRSAAEADKMLADQSSGVDATADELRESLAMTRAGLAALVVRAPVAGRLTAFTLQPGQMIKPGDAVGQVDSERAWKLTADVDQFYLGRVRTGLSAVADLDGRSLPLTVIKVLPQVTEGRFRVELGFKGAAPAGLNRGQTLDVRLVLGADRPAVVAPSGGWLDAGGTTAFVLTSDSHAVRRAITTGRRNPDQVEVTSGLAPGDRIVTTPLGTYVPYQTLLIH
ncbi:MULTISPECIES: efflux RND transporter periplasmic adaptor subunit [Sphingomonas]|uniref:HlyD family secretion protein n=1 Tax=Sphingomonas trueperi TaxID=53317 RepID=A0A7X6BDM9_9SPHN|nr:MULTISPECIES: HlyD family efflux transporter periplasmic adaptor subunit [Sphingomonas]NJB99304.1 HlyD family secretion protein [Sphingomonas trueperi]